MSDKQRRGDTQAGVQKGDHWERDNEKGETVPFTFTMGCSRGVSKTEQIKDCTHEKLRSKRHKKKSGGKEENEKKKITPQCAPGL